MALCEYGRTELGEVVSLEGAHFRFLDMQLLGDFEDVDLLLTPRSRKPRTADGLRLFRASLHAALTLPEAEEFVRSAGLRAARVYRSSDRHLTIEQVA